MRIAEQVARDNHCLAIATGESVGQVASQTLESMVVINDVLHMPILRPVVCFDKEEIIEVAKNIGTYETSILPFEDCCTIFDPKNPVTKPKLDKCVELESRFDYESFIRDCLDTVETVTVYPQKDDEDFL